MESIMERSTQAAETMRRGGGIGFDFSRIRPSGDRIVSLDSSASGPVSFMGIFDAVCQPIMSAGHRRGAMMAVLRVDHPDIEEFIRAKRNENRLTNFNISVGVTDEFMECVRDDKPFTLQFDQRQYRTINAKALWDEIMRNNWDWAEPGVLFLDRINNDNPLWYCETISATNPCGEQPLPPYGACLLGSFNLVKYVNEVTNKFDFVKFKEDIPMSSELWIMLLIVLPILFLLRKLKLRPNVGWDLELQDWLIVFLCVGMSMVALLADGLPVKF